MSKGCFVTNPGESLYRQAISSSDGRTVYDAWEIATPEERQRHRLAMLGDIVSLAKTLPFYQDRLSGINVEDQHPLLAVPPLESEDLRRNLPPTGEGLIADRNSGYTVFQSGGTTGIPKTSLFGFQEMQALKLGNARGFFATGLTPEDRVANLWAVGGLYMTFVHINQMLEQYGCASFPFSNKTPVEFVANVIRAFDINCVSGIASVVLNQLRQSIASHSGDFPRIEKIYYGGEHFYDNDRDELRENFGAEIIAAPGYGTVDSWYLGYQCSRCPPGVFHVHDDQVYLEVIDEETSKPCLPNQEGMLYATVYVRRVTPIIRYRVGDRVYWNEDLCSCGRTTPTFKLLGRGDDVLRIGFDSVDYAAIQGLAAPIEGLSGSIQMEKCRRDGKDVLVVRVESDADPSRFDALKKLFSEALYLDRGTIREAVENGSIHPVEIEIFPLSSIPLNSRTGKLRRVIDVQ